MSITRIAAWFVASSVLGVLGGCSAELSAPVPDAATGEFETRSTSRTLGSDTSVLPNESDAPFRSVDRQEVTELFSDGSVRCRYQVVTPQLGEPIHHGRFVEYYRDGGRFSEGYYDRGERDGVWTYWHRNATKARTTPFVRGTRHGTSYWYRDAGTLSREESYRFGKKNGCLITYAADGKSPLRKENFCDGERHGTMTRWYENGVKANEIEFENGVPHGIETRWHENGRPSVVGNYSSGWPDGEFKYWASDGTFIKCVSWDRGRRMTQSPLASSE